MCNKSRAIALPLNSASFLLPLWLQCLRDCHMMESTRYKSTYYITP